MLTEAARWLTGSSIVMEAALANVRIPNANEVLTQSLCDCVIVGRVRMELRV